MALMVGLMIVVSGEHTLIERRINGGVLLVVDVGKNYGIMKMCAAKGRKGHAQRG